MLNQSQPCELFLNSGPVCTVIDTTQSSKTAVRQLDDYGKVDIDITRHQKSYTIGTVTMILGLHAISNISVIT